MVRRPSTAALLALATGVAAFLVRFAVLLPRGDVGVEPATFRAYRIDSDRFDGPRLEIDWIGDDGRVKPIRVTFDR